jgi:sugar/nucleoside kinase (ribokinase family)
MKKARLVAVGDLMLDVVVRAQTPLEFGSDVAGSIRFRLGGSAGNTCREFARLGGKAALVCAVGDDKLGKHLIAAHRADDVTVHSVRVAGATPRLAAVIGARGERSFITDRGVADTLSPSSLKESWFRRADILHVPAYSLLNPPLRDASLLAASWVRGRGGTVSVDLASRAPLRAAGVDGLAAVREARPTFLFANVDEVAAVVGRQDRRILLEMAPIVVVKLGPGGCLVMWRNPTESAAAVEIEVATKATNAIDTTGAGDAFAAGFLYGFLERSADQPFPKTLRHAALVGHRCAARLLAAPRRELDL